MLFLAALAMNLTPEPHDKALVIRNERHVVFQGTVAGVVKEVRESVPAEPVFLGYPHGPKTADFVPPGRTRETIVYRVDGPVSGTVIGSKEAFACNDRAETVLGSAFGRPASTLDDAVYDRAGDWLLSCDAPGVSIRPIGEGRFRFDNPNAAPMEIRLRLNYYRDHLGYFLWDRASPQWKAPVAGWCSWMAYLQDVREKDVLDAAHFFAANLKDYGYSVIQIDDGYQRVSQFPSDGAKVEEPFADYWTIPNSKFPAGLEALAHQIASLGLTPGIWIGEYLPLGLKHADGYVTDSDGHPHKGPWVGYAMNGLDPAAAKEAYFDTIRTLHDQGWRYFKIDTLRHILYDNYRQTPEYWRQRGQSMETAYRHILSGIREAIGPESYLLACWGTIPELAGIPYGARIGEDVGPDPASMRRSAKYIAQFQYLNDVVWRNDPDYMCLRVPLPQAEAWATLTSLAGGHVMVSDPMADYDSPRVDVLRRVGPPLVTRPVSVVSHPKDPEFLTLAAEKGGESWLVAARFGWGVQGAKSVPLSDFGLDPGRAYLAYDFWRGRFLGIVHDRVDFDPLEDGSCQVVSLRPLVDHPQVLGTSRHIGQGAYELEHVRWADDRLGGAYVRGPGRVWTLELHCPANWEFAGTGNPEIKARVEGEVVTLTFPEGATPMTWETRWRRRS